MNENELMPYVDSLLKHSAKIVQDYDRLYFSKGLKYNIFEIAEISEKEVIICRVIADLLNPKGRHYKGNRYLKIFLDIIAHGNKIYCELKTENAKVTPECPCPINTSKVTDKDRRIDIVIEDGIVFIPIEAKIWANDQPKQVADYYAYAKEKNHGNAIPVLYLTPDGHPPDKSSTDDGTQYKCISFKKDILTWLTKCRACTETEAVPVREILKQLIGAVRSICGYTEDEQMEKTILKEITQSDETIKAALEIYKVLNDIDSINWEKFKNNVFENVKKQLPAADFQENVDGWDYIDIPLKNGAYILYVNYDWKKITVEQGKKKISESIGKNIHKLMADLYGVSDDEFSDGVWLAENTRYPRLKSVDEEIYPYLLYRQYEQNPAEAANHIIKMVDELEKIMENI
jgi:hypothetical protein